MIKTIKLADGKVKELAHELLKQVITPNDIVVDATMGNGYDTVFLAGLSKNVFAFDVQQKALDETRKRLGGKPCTLIKDGHENVDKYVKSVKAAIFNLGYLPNADKSIITLPQTTLQALNKLSEILAVGGRIAIVIYAGHSGGEEEKQVVLTCAEELDKKMWSVTHYIPQDKKNPPTLLVVDKLVVKG